MFRSLTLTLAVIVLGGVSPAALAAEGPTQPTASERLIRQEDARWSDPRLGITYPSPPQPAVIERLVRQEDARADDPRLGIGAAQPAAGRTPTVNIIRDRGFDWLAAAIGAVAGMASLILASGLAILARTERLGHA